LKLSKDLRAAGVDLWVDQLDVKLGENWDDATEEALNSCEVLLLILSSTSVTSKNVKDEIAFALEENKRIVPVLYQECKVPLRIRRLQHSDFTQDYTSGLRQVLTALNLQPKQEKATQKLSEKTSTNTESTLRSAQKRFDLGNDFFSKKDYQKAIDNYNKAIELDPTNGMYHNNLGLCFYKLGDYNEAIESYSRATELYPTKALILFNRANVYSTRGRQYEMKEDIDKAQRDYSKAIDIFPDYADAYFFRANNQNNYLSTERNYEQQIRDYTKAIELKNIKYAHNNRGFVHERLGNLAAACDDFICELELYPAEEDASQSLFELLRKLAHQSSQNSENLLDEQLENRIANVKIHSKHEKAISLQLQKLKSSSK
jgi:tetratricopeptide (TPR) repeat protein